MSQIRSRFVRIEEEGRQVSLVSAFLSRASSSVGARSQEYAAVGDQSALHVIVLDEMDSIARKRGSLSGDTTGVRDGTGKQRHFCME